MMHEIGAVYLDILNQKIYYSDGTIEIETTDNVPIPEAWCTSVRRRVSSIFFQNNNV